MPSDVCVRVMRHIPPARHVFRGHFEFLPELLRAQLDSDLRCARCLMSNHIASGPFPSLTLPTMCNGVNQRSITSVASPEPEFANLLFLGVRPTDQTTDPFADAHL